MTAVATQTQALPSKATRNKSPRKIGRPSNGQLSVGREGLLAIACQLLKSMPPSAITPALIARHAQVDPGLVWYYFKGRSALFRAMLMAITDEFPAIVEEASPTYDSSPIGRLSVRISALVELHVRHPFFDRLIDEVEPSDEGAKPQIDRRAIGEYKKILDFGEHQGVFRNVDETLMFGAITGMCQVYLRKQKIIDQGAGHIIVHDELKRQCVAAIVDLLMFGLSAE